jgi:hypothetical protein
VITEKNAVITNKQQWPQVVGTIIRFEKDVHVARSSMLDLSILQGRAPYLQERRRSTPAAPDVDIRFASRQQATRRLQRCAFAARFRSLLLTKTSTSKRREYRPLTQWGKSPSVWCNRTSSVVHQGFPASKAKRAWINQDDLRFRTAAC